MTDARLARLFADPVSAEQIRRAEHPKRALVARCLEALAAERDEASSAEAVGFFIPGRIEVFGKHMDYCGGRSLICAVDRGFAIVARARRDTLARVIDARRGERCELALGPDIRPQLGHWSNYPATVARRLWRNFGGADLRGADIAFASDLPPAAGLSSSSAFIVGVLLALGSLNRLHESPAFAGSIRSLEDLAHYGGCIENGSGFRELAGDAGVGTSGGSQDHTAILCCRAGRLSRYGFAPVTFETEVALPEELALVVLNSGVVAEKTGSARELYNAVSHKARTLVELWNRSTGQNRPTLASIVRSAPSAADELSRLIETAEELPYPRPELLARLRQFIDESERIIPAATDALRSGDLRAFAELVERSVEGAVRRLENQIPATIDITAAALRAGAIAASPFGAGFGGSVWAMVRRPQLSAFVESLGGVAAEAVPVSAADGAHPIR